MKPRTMLVLVSGIALGTISVQSRASSSVDDNGGKSTAALQSEYETLIAPCIQKARSTYPQARSRFLAGLSGGDSFYVMTRIKDANGQSEHVFVRVAVIDERTGSISGQLASPLKYVRISKPQQPISFSEADVLDWAIVKRDGSEEGNFVGTFVDRLSLSAARKAWGDNARLVDSFRTNTH